MSEQENVEQLKRLFNAFVNGDIQTVLNATAADTEWTIHGPSVVPFYGRREGRDGAAQFFQTMAETVDFELFEPREFIAQGNRVVVLGTAAIRFKAVNRSAGSDWVMIFTMRDGMIQSLDQFEDTAAIVDAYLNL